MPVHNILSVVIMSCPHSNNMTFKSFSCVFLFCNFKCRIFKVGRKSYRISEQVSFTYDCLMNFAVKLSFGVYILNYNSQKLNRPLQLFSKDGRQETLNLCFLQRNNIRMASLLVVGFHIYQLVSSQLCIPPVLCSFVGNVNLTLKELINYTDITFPTDKNYVLDNEN
jgi:hypothetical protein